MRGRPLLPHVPNEWRKSRLFHMDCVRPWGGLVCLWGWCSNIMRDPRYWVAEYRDRVAVLHFGEGWGG